MNICILRGSPRKNGNTNSLVSVFKNRLTERGTGTVYDIDLNDIEIRPCTACRECQKDWNRAYCIQKDDLKLVIDGVSDSDVIVIATPIYSWYCTPPVKAVLDRLVYAMNMFYGDGDEKGPALWAGKKVALITTSGYPKDKGADLFEEGIKRYCKHSELTYMDMLWERHPAYVRPFMDEGKEKRAAAFADFILNSGDLL